MLQRLKSYLLKLVLKKGNPYIIDLTFSKYDVQKKGEQITSYSISEILCFKLLYTYI